MICAYSTHGMVKKMWCGMLLTTWRPGSPIFYEQFRKGA